MKRLFTLLSILWIASSSYAQPNYAWTAHATSTGAAVPGNSTGRSVAVDAQGNVYTTGSFQGTVDFDPGPGVSNLTSAGGIDIFVQKLDASGNLIWVKSMGGTGADIGNGIAIDGSGNVYTTGYFNDIVDFDPGAGMSYLASAGGQDIFVQKLDASGNLIWVKSMGGTNADIGNGIAVDGSGNIYTTGIFNLTVDFDPGPVTNNLVSTGAADIFVQKLDASGNFVWAKRMGGTDVDQALSIAVDGSGNGYTTGTFGGTADFDPGAGVSNLISAGAADIFVQKIDASGNFVWAKRMGGASGEVGYAIAVDGNGNVYTTGYFFATVDFDPGAGTTNLTSVGNADIFIQKLNSSGNFVWARGMGSTDWDNGNGIVVDGSGNVYTTGAFASTADFDPGPATSNLTSAGFNDIFIQKLDATGNFVWAKRMGSTLDDSGNKIVLDGSGNIYTAGHFTSSTTTTMVNVDPVGGYDFKQGNRVAIFTQKLAPQCSASGLANSLDAQRLGINNVIGAYVDFQQNCRAIARLQSVAGSPVSADVMAKVWIESSQPAQYVKRHYEITPATNAATGTGRVTLYFTQAEFNEFNGQSPAPALLLPTGPEDATGIANLKVEKRPGTSSDDTGLPNTYTGTPVTIDPADTDIVWNATLSRWEVSFAVTGFSGFFIKTQAVALPVTFGDITAVLKNGKLLINFSTVMEKNSDHYNVQVSKDCINFTTIATLKSQAIDGNSDTLLKYEIQKSVGDMAMMLGIPALLALFGIGFRRKNKTLMLLSIIVASSVLFVACSKKDTAEISNDNSKYFVRIVQVDKDGTEQISKVITVVAE